MALKNIFFKMMKNLVFGKTIKNLTKHIDIKSVTTEKRKKYLVSKQNFHIVKSFSENLLAIEMKNKNTDTHK